MPVCVAFSCNNKSKGEGHTPIDGITFHKFPRDPKKKFAWAKAVGRKNWSPSSSSFLCSEHFEERYIDRTSASYVKLRDNAVPTIFIGHPNHKRKRKVYKPISSENESDELENSDVNENQQNSDENENQENSNEFENQEYLEEYENQEYMEEYENQENLDEYENQEYMEEYENQENLDEFENQDYLDGYENQENENGEEEIAQDSESEYPEYTEETLICMIKDNPVLYDKTVPDYWKKIRQNQTWRALADVLKIPVKECQHQWDDLLSKYSSQREVIYKFKAKGHKAKSTWPLYDVIDFMDKHLDNHLVELTRGHKIETKDTNLGKQEHSEFSHTEDHSRTSYEEENVNMDSDNLSATHSDGCEKNPEPHSRTDEVINDMTQSPLIRVTDNVSATKRVITDINEDVQFINSLLPILVRMKRKKKAQCKAELMTILANYESEDEP